MKLVVGFILYNEFSAKYLPFFLPSLLTALSFLAVADYEIYAFDNSLSSHDENRRLLKDFERDYRDTKGLAPKINYFSQGANLGYSRAYNILINEALKNQAQYFLILNPDILLEPGAIESLLNKLEADRRLASVAPKIRRWDFSKNVQTTIIDSAGLILEPGLKFLDLGQGQVDRGQFDRFMILGPSGAAGLFRLDALVKIAERRQGSLAPEYFDERFFMYKEDCDLSYRLFLAAYKSVLVPESLFYHDRTATASGRGIGRAILDRRHKSQQIRAWSFKNQHLIFLKHWKTQNFVNRCFIIVRILNMFVFALILEQFLLKQYYYLFRSNTALTNIK